MAEEKPDSQALMKLLEMGKNVQRFKYDLFSAYKSPDEMVLMLTPICSQPGVMARWVDKLRLVEETGILELRKSNPRRAEALGIDEANCPDVDESNSHRPWSVPTIRTAFFDAACQQLNLTIFSLDPLSRIAGFSLTSDSESNVDDYSLFNPDVWISWHRRGARALLQGEVKMGKSNAALLISEVAISKGIEVISNIYVKDPPSGYYYAPTLSSLLEKVCQSNMQKRESMLVFDEGTMFWARQDAPRRNVMDMNKLMFCFGKFHSSMLYINHRAKMVPSTILEHLDADFRKIDKTTMFADIRSGKILHSRVIRRWPSTTLDYSPDQIQSFSIDLNFLGLLSFMTKVDPGEDEQWGSLLSYVRRHAGEIQDTDIDAEAVAEYFKREGYTNKQIAEKLEKDERTIRRWLERPVSDEDD